MTSDRSGAQRPHGVTDWLSALAVLSLIFWPLAIFVIGVWFLLWVLRGVLLAVLLIALAVERLTHA